MTELEDQPATLAQLDQIRRRAAVTIGLRERPENAPMSNPKVAIVSAPADYTTLDGAAVPAADYDLGMRISRSGRCAALSPSPARYVAQLHKNFREKIVADIVPGGFNGLRIGSPSGVFNLDADVGVPEVRSASLFRRCRRLMQGTGRRPPA